MIKKIFFISPQKKIIEHFAAKSFSVFWGAHGRPLNTKKTFLSAKCFIIIFHAYENTFAIILKNNYTKNAGIV